MQQCMGQSQWSSPLSFIRADEELGSVGVGSSISHGQYATPCVLQLEVLISKLLSIDGFASGSITFGKVPTLYETNGLHFATT